MDKVKVKCVKDSRHEKIAIFNGKSVIGIIEINELVDFFKDESKDTCELISC